MTSRQQRTKTTMPKLDLDDELPATETPEEPPAAEEQPAPEPVAYPPAPVADSAIEVIGIRLAPNKNFIFASMNGERIAVFVGKRQAARLTGKKFKVTVEHDGTQTNYRYTP